jgi:hypothetical protein
LLLLLFNEGGGVHHRNLGSGIGVERWLLWLLLLFHGENGWLGKGLSKVLNWGGWWCFHNLWGNNLSWLVKNCWEGHWLGNLRLCDGDLWSWRLQLLQRLRLISCDRWDWWY